MAKEVIVTPKKPRKYLNGKEDGIVFTKDNQPTPEAKKKGWEEWRKERHLTQAIIAHLGKGNNFNDYIKSVVDNAKIGNSKALDIVSKCIEEDIIKVDHTVTALHSIDPTTIKAISDVLNSEL